MHVDRPIDAHIDARPLHRAPFSTSSLLSFLPIPGALLPSLPRVLWQARALPWQEGFGVHVSPERRTLVDGEADRAGRGRCEVAGARNIGTLCPRAGVRFCRREGAGEGCSAAILMNDFALFADAFSPAFGLKSELKGRGRRRRGCWSSSPSARALTIISSVSSAVYARLLGASEEVSILSDDTLFDAPFPFRRL